ncbi:MAG: hypothetical protein JXA89_05820 [Anaerolineae bacterium]|nr:hypothetical protein [Anaerolineae bacterium]
MRFAFRLLLPALCLAVLFLPVTVTFAQSGGGYDISWWTVDGGGIIANESSGYTLGGTAGQPDAAVWSGGDYALAGGFWGGVAVEYRIYLPLVLRGA